MAHSAVSLTEPQKAGRSEHHEAKAMLDMERFWSRPSIRPPVPIEQWKKEFTLALYAKTMIRVQEVKNYMEEPMLNEPMDEPQPPGVETNTQEEARLGRNKAAKEAAKQRYEAEYKRWKEASVSGLNLTAANYRAKAILYMMMGPEAQRRFKNKLPHVDIEEDSVDFGDL